MASIFDTLKQKQGDVQKSASWYRNAVKSIQTSITAGRLMRENKLINRPSAGRLNLFMYDPKTKDRLPLYDIVPLVLPLEPIPGGFLGMNFHYLPPLARYRMLEQLQKFATNSKFDRSTKLDLGYDDIKKSKLMKPTIKKYLYSYTRSKFLRIDANEAAISIFLPVQRFKKGRPY
tara:strand:- start:115 stop:639 length:525 start_codon:yes stop_codon:yes gene_type:complete